MDVEEIRKYIGKKVLVILNNNYKFTLVIPQFSGETFTTNDRYGKPITIDCSMISMIYEVGDSDD